MRSIGDKPTCYGREISVCGVCYSQCWRLKNAAGLEPAALTSEKRSTSGLRFVETSVNGMLSTWQTGSRNHQFEEEVCSSEQVVSSDLNC